LVETFLALAADRGQSKTCGFLMKTHADSPLNLCMSVCHSAGVIHGDIKLENVLLDAQNHVKLIDLGTAMIMSCESTRNELQLSSIVGQAASVAPELLSDGIIRFSSDT
jgi:serine/threonine protein kinase